MKLQIVSEDGKVLFELNGIDSPPYGLEVVNARGGLSLTSALRSELVEFLYEYEREKKSRKCGHICLVCNPPPKRENPVQHGVTVLQFPGKPDTNDAS